MEGESLMNENNNKVKHKVMSRIKEIKLTNVLSSISSIAVIITSIVMIYDSTKKPNIKVEYKYYS